MFPLAIHLLKHTPLQQPKQNEGAAIDDEPGGKYRLQPGDFIEQGFRF